VKWEAATDYGWGPYPSHRLSGWAVPVSVNRCPKLLPRNTRHTSVNLPDRPRVIFLAPLFICQVHSLLANGNK